MSAVFDVVREGGSQPPSRAPASSCCSTPARSGPSAPRSATACCRAAAGSTGAPCARGRRTASFKGGSLGAGRRRDDRPHDRRARPRSASPSSASRTRAAPACRRASAALHAYSADLPRPGRSPRVPQISVDRRPVRRRRGVLARARRPDRHGRARGAHVPDRPDGRRAGDPRARQPRRPRRREGPRARTASPTSSPATTCTPPSWSAPRCPPALEEGRRRCRCTRRRTRRPATRPTSCPSATARSTTCATSPRASSTAARCSSSAPRWARNLVVGFARIEGAPVGVIANQPRHLGGMLDAEAAAEGRLVRRPVRPLRRPARRARRHAWLPAGREPGAGRRHPPRRLAAARVQRRDHPARNRDPTSGVWWSTHRHELSRPRCRPHPRLAQRQDRRHGRARRPWRS